MVRAGHRIPRTHWGAHTRNSTPLWSALAPPTTAFGADARVLPVPAVVTALDERRAGGWPLAALLLSTTLGAKRKSATID